MDTIGLNQITYGTNNKGVSIVTFTLSGALEMIALKDKEITKLQILLAEAEQTIINQQEELRPMRENVWDENQEVGNDYY